SYTPGECEWFASCLRDLADRFSNVRVLEPDESFTINDDLLGFFAIERIAQRWSSPLQRGVDYEVKISRLKSSPSCCPFGQSQQTIKDRPTARRVADSVLENLERLELAQEMFKLGENYRKARNYLSAIYCFDQVQALCPGSQWDCLAQERRSDL